MAYTDDAVKAKLSALNETQDSIVTCSQWIMFHRRHADRTAQLWMQRLRDSTPSKRLNLIYLANEVVQQSKARKKNEFVDAFTPIIAEATSTAYKGVPHDIQQKLRRTIEVWRHRAIFPPATQSSIEARIDELDRSRTATKKPTLGGSLFSNGAAAAAPPELQPLVPLQTALTKASLAVVPAAKKAEESYAQLGDPSQSRDPPVHAARLNAILHALATAEGAVKESIRARGALLSALETLLEANRAALQEERTKAAELGERQRGVDGLRREVEDGIMRDMPAADHSTNGPPLPTAAAAAGNGVPEAGEPEFEPPRPEIEGFTPPPVESLTPEGSPPELLEGHRTTTGADVGFVPEQEVHHDEPPPDYAQLPPVVDPRTGAVEAPAGGFRPPLLRARSGEEETGVSAGVRSEGRTKRRKVGSGGSADEFAGFMGEGMDGIDEDVAAMLGGGEGTAV